MIGAVAEVCPVPGETCPAEVAAYERGEFPCPRCGKPITDDENWQRHHSLRGWFGRNWRRYVSKWFVP